MHDTKSQWFHAILMFAVASFFYLYEFLLRVVPSVMKPQLVETFNLSATQFGVLSAIYFAAYSPLQLPVGALIDKYGARRLLTLAILMCAVSTLLSAYTSNYYLALIARFFIGAGSAFGFISCMKVLTVWFPAHWFSIMTGLTLTIGTTGAAASWPISHAMNYIEWRDLLAGLGFIGLAIGVIAWLVVRDQNPRSPLSQSNDESTGFWQCLKAVAIQPQCWFVGFYAFLITAPTDAFGGAWGVTYLTEAHGMDKDAASFAQAMVFVGIAVGSPLLGFIAKIIDNRKITMFTAGVIASLALSIIIYGPHLEPTMAAVLFFIFGTFGTYVLAFVVARIVVEDKYVGTAVGFVNMLSTLGSFCLTLSIGWVLDLVRNGAINSAGEPVYLLSDFKVGLMALPIFYAIASLVIVPMIVDRPLLRNQDD